MISGGGLSGCPSHLICNRLCRECISVRSGEEKNSADFGPDLTPSFQADMPAFAEQIGGLYCIETRAITEGFPVHPILAVKHHFVRVGAPALTLGGAKDHVDHGRPVADVRMGNQHNGMLASLVREMIPPDIKLVFHLDSSGPWTQADNMASCSLSRSGVRYLRRLPRGKVSLAFCATSLRPRISPSSTRHSTWSLGFKPTAEQMDSGKVIRCFLSMMVALIEGLSLKNDISSSAICGFFNRMAP
jgi:hypothetical protein